MGQGTILLLGANGQVGFEVCRLAKEQNIQFMGLTRHDLDLADPESLNAHLNRHQPALIINAAAYTAVDKAEEEQESAKQINEQAPAILAGFCHLKGIPLLHLSTDYVFDGNSKKPYAEEDQTFPASIYGQSKLQGEIAICNKLDKHIIIRTSWVFGPHGNNFVKSMLRLAKTNNELKVVADQFGCPTAATHIAQLLLNLAGRISSGEDLPWGIYHYCGRPSCSWHGFAEKIIEIAIAKELINHPVAVKKITTADYPTPAQRPHNSILDCQKIFDNLNIGQPDWLHGLNDMLVKNKE